MSELVSADKYKLGEIVLVSGWARRVNDGFAKPLNAQRGLIYSLQGTYIEFILEEPYGSGKYVPNSWNFYSIHMLNVLGVEGREVYKPCPTCTGGMCGC